MPAAGQTWVDFNDSFFEQILNSVGVKELTRQAANRVLAEAKASAPVGDPSDPVYKRPERRPGQYRDGLGIEEVSARIVRPSWSSDMTPRPCSSNRRPGTSARR